MNSLLITRNPIPVGDLSLDFYEIPMLSQIQGEDFTWGKKYANIACNKKKRNTDKNKADLSQKKLGVKAFHAVQQVI